jgi:hypothetical protein
MTSEKTPTLLLVVIKSASQQWFVAGIDLDGTIVPLVRSEPHNLDQYVGQSDDEQLSFLRHRLSGAMQRGCDRLWARNAKATRIVLIADSDLPESDAGLLPRLAEHFHTWMTRPPVSFYRGDRNVTLEELDPLECLVDKVSDEQAALLQQAMPSLCKQMAAGDCWEIIQKPKA